MAGTITVGLDGSAESRAAAEWAAREAKLRELPLKLLHVWRPVPAPIPQAPLVGAETFAHWSERIPRETAEGLRLRHPGVTVTHEQASGVPAEVLASASDNCDMLVLGTRGLGRIAGYTVGSVSMSVISHARVPVVLVRAGEQAADEHHPAGIASAAAAYRPVILGLDADSPDDAVISFAFEEAARRGAPLRAVHCWNVSPYYVYGLPVDPVLRQEIVVREEAALSDLLKPWRQKFSDVEVIEDSRYDSPALHLVNIAREGSLLVVGRRIRRLRLGAHIGPVAHAVLHHATTPVAIVAHGTATGT
ncbi:universal stress protein [Streptomyces sp. SID14478]|uniref:universal stress protein n=1 Tax=Streptomyces sp. SID14478 TaxID=2706073 RepID=UPI0013D95382|nr:universal stress protein [Streptomyces sp. SID14478]NEB74249.1 universal stress protein [Streptomyces sp. SID14478]